VWDLADQLLLGDLGRADRRCGFAPTVNTVPGILIAAIPFQISRLPPSAYQTKGMFE
jgi:hypothetical protein